MECVQAAAVWTKSTDGCLRNARNRATAAGGSESIRSTKCKTQWTSLLSENAMRVERRQRGCNLLLRRGPRVERRQRGCNLLLRRGPGGCNLHFRPACFLLRWPIHRWRCFRYRTADCAVRWAVRSSTRGSNMAMEFALVKSAIIELHVVGVGCLSYQTCLGRFCLCRPRL